MPSLQANKIEFFLKKARKVSYYENKMWKSFYKEPRKNCQIQENN